MVKLRTADRQRALGRIETAQCAIEPITTGVTADEDQIVCLVLVRDTASLVALAVPNLNVHRTREPQHAEVRLELIEVEHDPHVPLADQLFEGGAARANASGGDVDASSASPVSAGR